MANEPKPIEIDDSAELQRIVAEVEASGRPLVLRKEWARGGDHQPDEEAAPRARQRAEADDGG